MQLMELQVGFMVFFKGFGNVFWENVSLVPRASFPVHRSEWTVRPFFFIKKKNEYIYYFPRFSSSSSLFYVHTHTLNVGAFTFFFPFDFRQQQRIKSNRNR